MVEKIEFEKETQYQIAWEVQGLSNDLVNLKVDEFDLGVLSRILANNGVKGFGVTVIK